MKNFPAQLSRPQAIIRQALLNGTRLTTARGNKLAQTVDFRKIISRLREDGFEVNSYWEEKDGRRFKWYYHKQPLPAKGSLQANVLQSKIDLN